jgi:protein-S-isoprenylcysteine O-methyltransferase Ste14
LVLLGGRRDGLLHHGIDGRDRRLDLLGTRHRHVDRWRGVSGARASDGRRRGGSRGALWRVGSVVAVGIALRFARHDLDEVSDHSRWIEIPGLVLLFAATAFTIWARVRLGRMWSASPGTLQAHHELRTDGPYAITRHPIYTGLLGMVLGTVLVTGFGFSLAFLAVVAAVVATRIPLEERLMSKTFPDEYARYRERVPRLVPGLNLLRRPH